MFALFDYLRLSRGARMEARREAGLLIQEHGEEAERVLREKLRSPRRAKTKPELRLTLHYLRRLQAARRQRSPERRRRG